MLIFAKVKINWNGMIPARDIHPSPIRSEEQL